MFEGLGVGSRLAYMKLPTQYNWVPIVGGLLYGITTPIGIAVGLGIRSTYNPGTAKASIVSGVMDSLSSGILIYTGLVEVGMLKFLIVKQTDMLAAPGTRIFIQQGNVVRTHETTCICPLYNASGMWPNGSPWPLGMMDWYLLVIKKYICRSCYTNHQCHGHDCRERIERQDASGHDYGA